MVSLLTILIIFTFFYRPYYTMFGGVIALCTLVALANTFPDSFEWARPNNDGEGFGFKFLILGFLLLGIVEKYLREDYIFFSKCVDCGISVPRKVYRCAECYNKSCKGDSPQSKGLKSQTQRKLKSPTA